MKHAFSAALIFVTFIVLSACGDNTEPLATVTLHNDFNNPEMDFNPPLTFCKTSYRGVEFGPIAIGETSAAVQVPAGIDYVLMVAAWDDPDCNPENCLPIASKTEEEVLPGQTRTIHINLPNHQGPCPPEGVQPIPEAQYNRILELWPEYNFKPYSERKQITQCLD